MNLFLKMIKFARKKLFTSVSSLEHFKG